MSKRLQGVPPVSCRGTSPEVISTAEQLVGAPGRGRVVVGDMSAATALMPLARTCPVVYNAHNIESEYVHGNSLSRALNRAEMRRYERRLLTLAAESWMVSRADIASALELVPEARLRYAPNVVDVAAITPSAKALGRSGEDRESKLLMVGDFRYPPNRSGLEFLVRSVLPRVWRSLPEARLDVVGRGLERWSSPDPRIERAGFVEDLAPLYASADCVVVPLTEGAGTPLKFVEALAYGMPVVATPLAAKGLDVQAGVHYGEGADEDSFAEAVIAILRDGGQQIAIEGRRLAEREYSIEALAEHLAA
jgi:glycosyltransferase involved in cell wall biosynthesis